MKNKEIDMGHARALLSIDSPSQQIKLFKEVQKQGYSVRRVEEIAQMLKNGESIDSRGQGARSIGEGARSKGMPEEFSELRDRLSNFFHAKVQMTCSPKGKGKINILFDNEEELEHIMNALDKVNSER